jgi:hypothetical protein
LGGLGCFLSHRKALLRAFDLARDGCIVLVEDDVIIKPQFFVTPLQLPASLPDNWEIVLFTPRYRERLPPDASGKSPKTPWLKKPFGDAPVCIRDLYPRYLCSGAHFCLFRNRETIAQIVEAMDTLGAMHEIDHFYHLERTCYGLHSDFITTAPFTSDHN